jgi:thiosulfate/3-mercaptopyruvate sulfurtransferase
VTLIAPETLRARIGDPGLRICDVRWWLNDPGKGRRDYDAAHLPGAIFIDLVAELAVSPALRPDAGRHPLPDPAAFARTMEERGIGDGTEVVAYDDAGGTIAARLWWMLDSLGFDRVGVLDGGLQAWTATGGELTDAVPVYPRGHLHLGDAWTGRMSREELAARLGSIAVVDARAGERYRGEVEPIDPIAGHIPTAVSRPTGGSLGPDGRFLPPSALRDRFGDLGETVVSYCGSGVTACHTALAMRIAGLPDAIVYCGSYSDWSTAGMPVVTGGDPGERPGG